MDENTNTSDIFISVFSIILGGLIIWGAFRYIRPMILSRDTRRVKFADEEKLIYNNKTNKVDKLLISGELPVLSTPVNFNTRDKLSAQYINISDSINEDEGIEYSYTFWIKKRNGVESDFKDRGIILRGYINGEQTPLIKFGKDGNTLIIVVDTIGMREVVEVKLDGISPSYWAFIGIAVKTGDIRVYVGRELVSVTPVKRMISINDGPITVLPNLGDVVETPGYVKAARSGLIGDLRYHNYALDTADIARIYGMGEPKDILAARELVSNKQREFNNDLKLLYSN
jgi:hypothetical protein